MDDRSSVGGHGGNGVKRGLLLNRIGRLNSRRDGLGDFLKRFVLGLGSVSRDQGVESGALIGVTARGFDNIFN